MDGEKRKREEHNGEMEGKRKSKGENVNAEEGRQAQTATDDEVEEFYAILKRIHVAVKYFQEGPRKLTATRWMPRFVAEDFDQHNGVNNNNGGIEEDSGFDLNSDPTSS